MVPFRLRSSDILRILRHRRLGGLWWIARRRTRNAQVNGSNPFAGSRSGFAERESRLLLRCYSQGNKHPISRIASGKG